MRVLQGAGELSTAGGWVIVGFDGGQAARCTKRYAGRQWITRGDWFPWSRVGPAGVGAMVAAAASRVVRLAMFRARIVAVLESATVYRLRESGNVSRDVFTRLCGDVPEESTSHQKLLDGMQRSILKDSVAQCGIDIRLVNHWSGQGLGMARVERAGRQRWIADGVDHSLRSGRQ